jgi:protocatechuate 3,4-dioxygenase beta subunit/putative intracellular protease/amidase
VFAAAGQGRAFRVYTVADTTKPVRSQGFLTITPEFSIANCPKPDIVVIPGGETTVLLRNPDFMKWVRTTAAGADIMFSVCTGAFVLADAGLLDGKEATTHASAISGLKGYAAIKVRPERRVIDNGKTVTAAGVSAGIDGALHVVARLCGKDTAERTAKYMEYRWQPEEGLSAGRAATPDEAAAHAWFAGDWPAAAKGYEEVVAQNPGDGVALQRLGSCQMRQKRFEAAAASTERAVRAGQRQGDTLAQLGRAYAQLKRPADAAKQYEQALELGLREWFVYFDLSRAYALAGDTDKALAALEKAFAEGRMSDADGARRQRDFDGLRGDARFGAVFRKYASESKVTIPRADEPGEPLVVTGVVRGDGGQPLPGALVYVYHTDARGYYSPGKADREPTPRLFAYLRTDAQGRYEYRTIRPASYPNTQVPQHVHYEVTADGYKDCHTEFFFADDPKMTGKNREQAEAARMLVTVERDKDGVQRGTFDLSLARK